MYTNKNVNIILINDTQQTHNKAVLNVSEQTEGDVDHFISTPFVTGVAYNPDNGWATFINQSAGSTIVFTRLDYYLGRVHKD